MNRTDRGGTPERRWWPLLVAAGVAGLHGTVGTALLGARGPSLALATASTAAIFLGIAAWQCRRTADGSGRWPSAGTLRTATLALVGVDAGVFGPAAAQFVAALLAADPPLVVPEPDLATAAAVTGLLLASAWTCRAAAHAAECGDAPAVHRYLRLTVASGAAVVLGQAGTVARLSAAGHAPTDGPVASAVFALLALHALHVLAGLSAFGVVLAGTQTGRPDPESSSSPGQGVLSALSTAWQVCVGAWLVLAVAFYAGPGIVR